MRKRGRYIYIVTAVFVVFGIFLAFVPFFGHMSPVKGHETSSQIINLSNLAPDEHIVVGLDGSSVIIRRRSVEEISLDGLENTTDFKFPTTQQERFRPLPNGGLNTKFIVLENPCRGMPNRYESNQSLSFEWFCSVEASFFDSVGRLIRGSGSRNMPVPNYRWLSENQLKLITKVETEREKALKSIYRNE